MTQLIVINIFSQALFDKRYFVYLGPSTEEEDLPENASYIPDDEKFFSFNQFEIVGFPLNLGKICERGIICIAFLLKLNNYTISLLF